MTNQFATVISDNKLSADNVNNDPVSVILIVYNEAKTIENEIRKISNAIISKIPGSELIVAEDGSTDGTKEIIKRLVDELGIIHSTGKERKGYAKALKDAVKKARCPYIFFSDSGDKHDPQEFWKLYPLRNEYSVVAGVKIKRYDQWYRKLLTRVYNMVLSVFFNVRLKDADAGFRLYKSEAAVKVFNEKWINHDLINSEIALRIIYSGYSIKEVPISYRLRDGASRGLPNKKIPGATYRVICNFPKLRRELSSIKYPKGS